ncbi:MAG: SpoIID/LytB domain-containing protein [Acidimicrobiia bacterium]
MRSRSRPWGPALAVAAVLAAGLVPLVGVAPAAAAPGGPVPPGGWVASRVRFEPLDPAATGLTADGGPGHRGALELGPGGKLLADLPVEDYVRGIQEVPLTWPAAALQAQAIAARTFALHTAMQARAQKGRPATAPDICATESCQVYTGLVSEQRPGGPAWAAATAATAGKVLLYKGAPILAKYSSSNGGRSVSGGRPYLPSVNDPDDAASPLHRWSQPLGLAGLTSLFGLPGRATGGSRNGGTVTLTWERAAPAPPRAPTQPPASSALPPATGSTTPAPPAPTVERGETRLPVGEFRSRVNGGMPRGALPRTLPSDQFSLAPADGALVAQGRGFGHAIGMGQWGAFGKARRGLSADAILASYYGGLRPQPAPPSAPPSLRVELADVGNPVVRAVPTGSGPAPGAFRVVADGALLATVATGSWKVTGGPRGGTVRIVPPPEQGGPLALEQVAAGRTGPDPASPVAVAFRTNQAALVSVAGRPPQPLAGGEHRVEVPGGPDAQTVTVAADAGGGRTATVAVEVAAIAPAAAAGPAPVLAPAEPGVAPVVIEDPGAFGLLPAPGSVSLSTSAQADAGDRPGPGWLAVPILLLGGATLWAVRRGRRPRGVPG